MRLGSLLGPLLRPEAAEPPSPLAFSLPGSVRRSCGSWRGFAVPRTSYRRTALGRRVGPSEGRSAFPRPSGLDRSDSGPWRPAKAARQRGAEPGMAEGRSGVDCLASRHPQRIEPFPPLICGLRTWAHSRRRGRRPRPSAALPVGGPGRASGCGLRAQPHPPEDHRRGRVFAINKINGLELRHYQSFDSGRYHSFDSPAYHYRQRYYLW